MVFNWFCILAVVLVSFLTIAAARADDDGASSNNNNNIPILRQVHVITRHGARFPLTKHATTLQEGTPGTLTPRGEQQSYDLGVWLAKRYMTLHGGADFVPHYIPHKVYLSSSSYDRTITSANALALGLYADRNNARDDDDDDATDNAERQQQQNQHNSLPANIPVYSQQVSNDVTIRAYDKCPVFLTSLTSLYASQEWQQLEMSSRTLRTKLVERFPDYAAAAASSKGESDVQMVPLEDIWNVFDAILVAKTECGDDNGDTNNNNNATTTTTTTTQTCQSLKDPTIQDFLSTDEWQDLQQLAHTAEFKKYYTNKMAALTIGTNLLQLILRRMQQSKGGGGGGGSSDDDDDDDDANSAIPPKDGSASFYLYSAHYPALLGLFASLGQNPSLEEVIPSYASALVLELYQVGNSKMVKLFYRTGQDLQEAKSNMVLGFDKICPLDEMCPLRYFQSKLPGGWSEEEWCGICGNRDADVCLAAIVKGIGSCSNSSGSNVQRPALAGFLSGFGISLLSILSLSYYYRRRKSKSNAVKSMETGTSEVRSKDQDSPII